MKPDEFQKTMVILAAYYPSVELSDETLKAYWLQFRDCSSDDFATACNKAVKESEFFPTVALINKYMNNDISYEEVVNDLREIIQSDTINSKLLNPVTRQVLNAVGGKMSLGLLSDKDFDYKVKREYKFAIAGIKDDKPKIDSRYGETKQIGEIIGEIKDD